MNKLKIFIYHLAVFIAGSVGLVVYTFIRLTSLKNAAGLGGVIVMPVITVVYVVVFGLFCAISLIVWLLTAYFHNRRK